MCPKKTQMLAEKGYRSEQRQQMNFVKYERCEFPCNTEVVTENNEGFMTKLAIL